MFNLVRPTERAHASVSRERRTDALVFAPRFVHVVAAAAAAAMVRVGPRGAAAHRAGPCDRLRLPEQFGTNLNVNVPLRKVPLFQVQP
jgi:hypothetical protein